MGKRNDEDPEEIKQLKRATEHIMKQIEETKQKIEDKKGDIYNQELRVEKNRKQADVYSHLTPA